VRLAISVLDTQQFRHAALGATDAHGNRRDHRGPPRRRGPAGSATGGRHGLVGQVGEVGQRAAPVPTTRGHRYDERRSSPAWRPCWRGSASLGSAAPVRPPVLRLDLVGPGADPPEHVLGPPQLLLGDHELGTQARDLQGHGCGRTPMPPAAAPLTSPATSWIVDCDWCRT